MPPRHLSHASAPALAGWLAVPCVLIVLSAILSTAAHPAERRVPTKAVRPGPDVVARTGAEIPRGVVVDIRRPYDPHLTSADRERDRR